jgi:aspartyl-tRNA synthetase
LSISGKTMSSSESQEPALSTEAQSKKAAKKEAAKLEKLRRKQEVAAAATAASNLSVEDDPLAVNYGQIPLIELQSKTPVNVNDWTRVEALNDSLENKPVQIRGRAQTIRPVGKKMAFLVIRENGFTVQCLVQTQPDLVSPQMVKFAAALSRESIVDVEGVVSIPAAPIKGATQQVGFVVLLLMLCDIAVF